MSLQEKHDVLIKKLENYEFPESFRTIGLLQQYKLAVKLYIEKKGVTIIPMQRNKYRKNYIENIYINKAFDNSPKSASSNILTELKRIRDNRAAQKMEGVSI